MNEKPELLTTINEADKLSDRQKKLRKCRLMSYIRGTRPL